MEFYFYFLLFAIFQIFLLIFLLEKRKKLNIKIYKLTSFWIMILGLGFLIGVGIYAPIKKSITEPKKILEYNISTNVNDFNMKDILEPIVSKLDEGKDIYFASYHFTFKIDDNQNITSTNCNLYGSYKGKYYQFYFSFGDGKCTLIRYQKAYENYYKDMNLLTVNEVLEMNSIINYEAFYNEYLTITAFELNKEVMVNLTFMPSKLNIDSTYRNINVLDDNGDFKFHELFDINLRDTVYLYFDCYINGNITQYLMVR